MDDFKDMLEVIVAIAGGAIYLTKAISKLKENSEQASKPQPDIAQSSDDDRNDADEESSSTTTILDDTKPSYWDSATDAQTTLISTDDAQTTSIQHQIVADRHIAECKATKQPKTGRKEGSKVATDSENTSLTQATPQEIAREFDLRKAVLYSEILKPKFDK